MRTETAKLEFLFPSTTFAPTTLLADTQWSSGEGDGKVCTFAVPFRSTSNRAAPEEATAALLTRHSDNRPSVGFIGAGALATTLAVALSAAGWKVDAVASRSHASARRLARMMPECNAVVEPQAVVDRCRIIFLTVPDDAITQVASSLDWPADRGVAHCSGAGTAALLSPAATAGALCGSFHPLQTFTSLPTDEDAAAVARARLAGVTFAVEGRGWLREALDAMALNLGGRTVEVKPEDRPLYHASAVMSCGALVALLRSAAALWRGMGVDEDTAFRSLIPLARTTLENAAALGAEAATTGPVVRGDVATLRRHLEALETHAPEFLSLYIALTKASIPLASALDGPKLCELESLLVEFDQAPSRQMKELSASGRKYSDGGQPHA